MSLLFAFPVLAISTDDLLLGSLATVTICCATVSVIGMIPLVGWRLGVLESLNLTLVVGLAIDYIVHMAEGFHISRKSTRKEKLLEVLHETGVSAVSGALSTLGAAVFMLFAQILFFMQFGLFVFCTVLFAIFYSMGIFVVLMALVGPETDRYSISKLMRKVRDRILKKLIGIEQKILEKSKSAQKFHAIPFEEIDEIQSESTEETNEIQSPIQSQNSKNEIRSRNPKPPPPITIHDQRSTTKSSIHDQRSTNRSTINDQRSTTKSSINDQRSAAKSSINDQRSTIKSTIIDILGQSLSSTTSKKLIENPIDRKDSIDDDNLSSGYESGTARLVAGYESGTARFNGKNRNQNSSENPSSEDFCDEFEAKKLKIGNLPIAMTPIAEEGSRLGIQRSNSALVQRKRSKSAGKIYPKSIKSQAISVKESDGKLNGRSDFLVKESIGKNVVKELDASALTKNENRKNPVPPLNSSQNGKNRKK